MPETFTTHYNLIKPVVGESANGWGGMLNSNMDGIDAAIAAVETGTLKKASNLSDLTDKPLARANLGLTATATLAVGSAVNTVAAGNDSRIAGALQGSNNLSDVASRASARANLELKGAAILDVGTTAGAVAAGDDARILGALQKADNLHSVTDKDAARSNLGLGALARLDKVNNEQWATGASLMVANGGTGATTAAAARTALGVTAANLGLGAFESLSPAAIRAGLTAAEVSAALGKPAMRVNSGSGTNTGLVSWGSAPPPETPHDGQIYLQYDP